MQNKRIVFVEQNRAELLEAEMPAPGAGQVRVRMMFSSVSSGTERANLTGDVNVNARAAADEKPVFPRYSGYSSAGVIDAVGDGVTDYHVGDRVAMTWSTHSLYQLAEPRNLYHLPEAVSFQDAALYHIACFPLAAIRKCRLEIGESALVMGLGILGLFAVTLLRAAGAAPVIAVDPVAEKREKALRCGADYALDPFAPDFAETVHTLTNGGANVAIEVTGVGAGLNGALDCMAKMGRVALLGCTRNSDFTVDYYRKVHGRGVSLIGAHTIARPEVESSAGLWTLRDDMQSIIRLSVLGRISLIDLVDEVHTPEEAAAVYDRLAHDKMFPIVQFDWRNLQ